MYTITLYLVIVQVIFVHFRQMVIEKIVSRCHADQSPANDCTDASSQW